MQDAWCRLYEAHARLPSHRVRVRATEHWLCDRLLIAEAPYVAFSGGKDSLALLALVASIDPSVPILTQGDDLDWPEKRAYCERVVSLLGCTDYEYRLSSVSARAQLCEGSERITGTFSHVVREYVRQRQLTTVLIGLRSEESRARRVSRARYGRDYVTRDGMRHLVPLADWSGRDVLAFCVARGLELFSLYTWQDALPPHVRRMSWPVVPGLMAHGEASFVKRHAPALWNQLARDAPHITTEA